jgi:hypothetical protein
VIVAHQVLLALSVAAVAGAGLRLASLTGASGLTRVVAAAVYGAAIAALEVLALGLIGLGGSSVLLAAAAALTWLAARLLVSDPGVTPGTELAAWWRATAPPLRLAVALALGAWLAWAVWLIRHPILGADSMIYHVPEVIEWVHNGRPGSISSLFPGYPVGAYPVTNEVLLAWASSIGRSFVPAMLWAPFGVLLLATAGWVGLRELEVPRWPAALALATLCLTPALTHWQKNGAHTDLPALAWLVCAAAMCAASVRRPALLPAVIIAAGLAVGTKTTTLPLTLLVLVIAAVIHRRRLTSLWRPLALPTGVALLVGGFWYMRNLVLHGSPFWPFVATPWGDPEPEVIAPTGEVVEQVYTRFLDTPVDTLDFVLGNWAKPFAGGLALLVAAMLAPLVARRRAVLAAAATTAASVLIWMNAPFTGVSEDDAGQGALTTMRYLLPAFAVAALTLGLTSREGRRGLGYALATLAVALGLTTWQLFDLGFPSVPAVSTVLAGAALGAFVGWLALLIPPGRLGWPRFGAVPAVVLAGLVLSLAASGFVERYRSASVHEARRLASAFPAMFDWFLARPEFRNGDQPIAFTVVTNAALAGDRLQHRIDLVSAREGCRRVRARVRSGWVVVNKSWPNKPCFARIRPRWSGGEFVVYGGEGSDRRTARLTVTRRRP